MDKVKGLSIVIIAILSVVLTVFIANKLLDTTGEVNQGNYRISDAIVESSATLEEVQDDKTKLENLSDMVFDVSQTNTISILVDYTVEASDVRLENFKVTEPMLKGKFNICQKDHEKYDITPELTTIPIYLEESDGKYIIRLLLDNDKVITSKSVSNETQKFQYDAAIFNTLDINTDELKFNVSFDLVITDLSGKTAKTSMSFNMPADETFTEGMSILRQDISKCIFTIMK